MTAESQQRSRDDVVRAAGRLFAERGFHGTSMRDLGSELGLLGSSLYSHVAGKHELLVEVVRRGAELFHQLAEDVLATDAEAPEQLRRLILGHVRIVVDNLDEARTILNEARFLAADERAPIVEMRNRYEDAYRTVIARGVQRGEIDRSVDPALGAIHVLSLLNAIERWYRPDGPMSPDDVAAGMCRFVEHGLGIGGRSLTDHTKGPR